MNNDVRYAGFWIRIAAHLLDQFIFSILSTPFIIAFGIYLYGWEQLLVMAEAEDVQGMSTIYIAYFAMFFLYYVVLNASSMQGTLGKSVVGLKMVNKDGRRISILRSLLRAVFYPLNYVTLFIGFFLAGWTRKKQALHDMLAGTYVIYRD